MTSITREKLFEMFEGKGVGYVEWFLESHSRVYPEVVEEAPTLVQFHFDEKGKKAIILRFPRTMKVEDGVVQIPVGPGRTDCYYLAGWVKKSVFSE